MESEYIKNLAQDLLAFLSRSAQDYKKDGLLVCMSGGVDSTLALKMCSQAVGPDKVLAVIMEVPGLNRQSDMDDAQSYAESLGVKVERVDMSQFFDVLGTTLPFLDEQEKKRALARLRLSVAYSFADRDNLKVVSCGNFSEEATRPLILHSSGAGDCFPFGGVFKTEIYGLANYFEIPQKFLIKQPSDSFTGDQRDMDYIGESVKYSQADRLLYLLVNKKYISHPKTDKLAHLLMGIHFQVHKQLDFPAYHVKDSPEREQFMLNFGVFPCES